MTLTMTPEELAARKRRNVWIALGLVAFMVLVFATTLLRMQRNLHAQQAIDAAAAQTSSLGPQAPAGQVIVPSRSAPVMPQP